MLGTFPTYITQAATSQWYLTKWQLPKCAILKRQLPNNFLAAALGLLVCSSRSAQSPSLSKAATLGPFAACGTSVGLTFVKLPLGNLHIWKTSTWDIVTCEVALGKMPVGKCITLWNLLPSLRKLLSNN